MIYHSQTSWDIIIIIIIIGLIFSFIVYEKSCIKKGIEQFRDSWNLTKMRLAWHETSTSKIRKKETNKHMTTKFKDAKVKKKRITGIIQYSLEKKTPCVLSMIFYINPNNDDWLAYIIGRTAGWGTAE